MVEQRPSHVSQMCNEELAVLAQLGDRAAREERLLREIMEVDRVDWEQARHKLREMDACGTGFYWLQTVPYRVGISFAACAALGACAFVFWPPAAEWYGVNVAGEELPDGCHRISDLTLSQVGAWTWQWMEPIMGTLSFVLLCAQFTRSCMWKLNVRTYGEMVSCRRTDRLCSRFPMYEEGIVRSWAERQPAVGAASARHLRR